MLPAHLEPNDVKRRPQGLGNMLLTPGICRGLVPDVCLRKVKRSVDWGPLCPGEVYGESLYVEKPVNY